MHNVHCTVHKLHDDTQFENLQNFWRHQSHTAKSTQKNSNSPLSPVRLAMV